MTSAAKKRHASREPSTRQLDAIADLVAQRRELDAKLKEAVAAAHVSGASWSQIGGMLGVSNRAAQRKYARAVATANEPGGPAADTAAKTAAHQEGLVVDSDATDAGGSGSDI